MAKLQNIGLIRQSETQRRSAGPNESARRQAFDPAVDSIPFGSMPGDELCSLSDAPEDAAGHAGAITTPHSTGTYISRSISSRAPTEAGEAVWFGTCDRQDEGRDLGLDGVSYADSRHDCASISPRPAGTFAPVFAKFAMLKEGRKDGETTHDGESPSAVRRLGQVEFKGKRDNSDDLQLQPNKEQTPTTAEAPYRYPFPKDDNT